MVDCKAVAFVWVRVDNVKSSECPLKPSKHPGEHDKCQLTEPREFNLMFRADAGARASARRRGTFAP